MAAFSDDTVIVAGFAPECRFAEFAVTVTLTGRFGNRAMVVELLPLTRSQPWDENTCAVNAPVEETVRAAWLALLPNGTEKLREPGLALSWPNTVTEAFAVLPTPALPEFTVTELFLRPGIVPVTFTPKVQDPFAGTVKPVKAAVPEPETIDVFAAQFAVRPLGVATTRPAGNASLKPTLVSTAVAFGFATVKL